MRPPWTSFILITLLALLVAETFAIDVGDTVRVIRRTELKVDKQSVGVVPSGTAVKIENLNGDWLWVTHDGKQGWLAKRDVTTQTPLLDTLIESEPANAGLYQMRGLTLLAQGQLDKAMERFNEGVRLAPNDANAYTVRGVGWYQMGKYDQAIADFDQALKLDPTKADALRNRGSSHRAKGELDLALADYDASLRYKPENAAVYSDRGDVWQEKHDYDRALDDYGESLKRDPKNESAYFHRGWIWDEKGNADKAIADFTSALKLNPKMVNAYIDRGNAWAQKEDYAKAIADYDQALRLEPNNVLAHFDRGSQMRTAGRYDEALADYRAAIDADPQFARAYNNAAWILAACPEAKVRNGKQAVEYALRACELNQWKQVGNLAAAYAEAGQFDAALKYQQQAVDLTTAEDLKANLKNRLTLFRAGRPYHEEADQN